jgi:porphobilinogen synthase
MTMAREAAFPRLRERRARRSISERAQPVSGRVIPSVAAGACRPRRLRQREAFRALIRETRLAPEQLVQPLFVRAGERIRAQIPSMPGQFQLSPDELVAECRTLAEAGVPAVLLFGLAEHKDERASHADARDGIVPQAIRAIKAAVPRLLIITDVCLCPYTSHGHCGLLRASGRTGPAHAARSAATARQRPPQPGGATGDDEVVIDEAATLERLAKVAVSHAQAGADMVAPSDMMDGNVAAVRQALDAAGFCHLPIMAYTAKFASSFYAPFREAVDCAPRMGDRQSYQMDSANAEEALREARLDIAQGADLIMVKPALAYLDVIYRLKQALGCPVAAFNVSGEYALVKAAAARGWLPERPVWLEILLGIKRAGADVLITYWAKEAVKWLRES